MLNRRGFTVVELIVVMVIMAILLILASVSISKSRANARDTQRSSNVDVLARGLEARYAQGPLNPAVTTPIYVKAGTYPSINEMWHIMGKTVTGFSPTQVVGGYGPVALPGTTVATFTGIVSSTNYGGVYMPCDANATQSACGDAESSNYNLMASTAGIVYEPIAADGNICVATECVRYNLYWRKETDPTPLQKYRSRHQ